LSDELQETFSSVTESINLKTLTLTTVVRVAVLILVGIIVIRILMKIVDRMLERSPSLNSLKRYIHSVVDILLKFVLVLMVAGSLDVDVSSIIALLSVAGLAVSLALQNTLSNLAGGIMILVSKPFAVGDYVETDGVSGTVTAIDLSYCSFATPDNKEIYIPNSQISAARIINYNRLGRRRMDLNFTASYDAPTAEVKAALQEVLDGQTKILSDPAPAIWLSDYQSSSIQYLVRVWVTAEDYWDVYYAIIEGVREAFDRHNVEMTYDHLNVHMISK
jgi:small conductance mechanosensitive channel